MNTVLAQGNRTIEGVVATRQDTIPGPWWWGGNTDDHGDVELRSRMPGHGVVDILRTCLGHRTDDALGAEWDSRADRQDCIGRDDYITGRRNFPHPGMGCMSGPLEHKLQAPGALSHNTSGRQETGHA